MREDWRNACVWEEVWPSRKTQIFIGKWRQGRLNASQSKVKVTKAWWSCLRKCDVMWIRSCSHISGKVNLCQGTNKKVIVRCMIVLKETLLDVECLRLTLPWAVGEGNDKKEKVNTMRTYLAIETRKSRNDPKSAPEQFPMSKKLIGRWRGGVV